MRLDIYLYSQRKKLLDHKKTEILTPIPPNVFNAFLRQDLGCLAFCLLITRNSWPLFIRVPGNVIVQTYTYGCISKYFDEQFLEVALSLT